MHRKEAGFAILAAGLSICAAVVLAATISEDFEGSSLGSTTPPSGWSMVVVDASPSYVTTNGAGGSGLGGQVTANHDLNGQGIPGG